MKKKEKELNFLSTYWPPAKVWAKTFPSFNCRSTRRSLGKIW